MWLIYRSARRDARGNYTYQTPTPCGTHVKQGRSGGRACRRSEVENETFSVKKNATGKPDGLEKGSTLEQIVMRGFLPFGPPPVGYPPGRRCAWVPYPPRDGYGGAAKSRFRPRSDRSTAKFTALHCPLTMRFFMQIPPTRFGTVLVSFCYHLVTIL